MGNDSRKPLRPPYHPTEETRRGLLADSRWRERKIDQVMPLMGKAAATGRSQVVAIGVAQEYQRMFTGSKSATDTGAVWFTYQRVDRRVTCYYQHLPASAPAGSEAGEGVEEEQFVVGPLIADLVSVPAAAGVVEGLPDVGILEPIRHGERQRYGQEREHGELDRVGGQRPNGGEPEQKAERDDRDQVDPHGYHDHAVLPRDPKFADLIRPENSGQTFSGRNYAARCPFRYSL
ncbi:hypothetical protein [Phytohabitans kaempferiae]|uniref:Uncharacterized protein n=1 Tax=Phytohabitans kaempferiae TaxID=1620943 RepID=A0ABV6M6S5_9ACTN